MDIEIKARTANFSYPSECDSSGFRYASFHPGCFSSVTARLHRVVKKIMPHDTIVRECRTLIEIYNKFQKQIFNFRLSDYEIQESYFFVIVNGFNYDYY